MKSIDAGMLKSTDVDLYVVPKNTKTLLQSLKLFNTDSVNGHSFVIFGFIGISKVVVGNGFLEASESAEIFDDPIAFTDGQKITGMSDSSNNVSWALFGETQPINAP